MMDIKDMQVRENPNLEKQKANIEKKFANRNYILLKGYHVNKPKDEDEYLMEEYSPLFLDLAIDWRLMLKQARLDENREIVGGNFVTDTQETNEAKKEVASALRRNPEIVTPKAEEVKTEAKEEEIKKRLKK